MKQKLLAFGLALTLLVTALPMDMAKAADEAGGDSIAEAVEVTLDTAFSGVIDSDDDEDWYKFTTTEGNNIYTIDGFSSGGYKRIISLCDNLGKELGSIAIDSSGERDTYKLPSKQTFYIKVSSNSWLGFGSYTIRVSSTPDEPDTAAEAAAVGLDTEYSGNISTTDDIDYYVLTTLDGTNIYDFDFVSLSGEFSYVIEEQSGARIAYDSVGRTGESLTKKLQPNSIYYVKIISYNGYTSNYKFKITATPDEPDTAAEATVVGLNTNVEGMVSTSNDVDYFTFTTPAELNSYTFNFVALSASFEYTIEDEKGAKISSCNYIDDKGVTIVKKLSPNTKYFLKLSWYDYSSSKYRFSISATPDEPDTLDSATAINPVALNAGTLATTDDVDYFVFSSDANVSTYTFTAVAPNGDSYANGVIEILDAKGTSLGRTVFNKEGKSLSVTLLPNATYYVKVKAESYYGIQYNFQASIVKETSPKTSLKKVKSTSKKTMNITWKKKDGATGYQIRYSTNKNMKKSKVKSYPVRWGSHTTTATISAKSKKTYYVQVRTYKVVNDVTVYSGWSKAKKVKVK